jgi:hypothetical protein
MEDKESLENLAYDRRYYGKGLETRIEINAKIIQGAAKVIEVFRNVRRIMRKRFMGKWIKKLEKKRGKS